MKLLKFLVFILISDCVRGLRSRMVCLGPSQCGLSISQEKIIGGVDSDGYRYPWFALLLLRKNSFLPVPICAGSLISSLYVLTAAHCFTISTSKHEDLFTVALGVYDICNDNEETRQIFNVAKVDVHEKYNKRGKFYDIALIKLSRPANYVFICLPLSGVPDITEVALLIGFGVTAENSNSVPCHMLEVNVTKYSKMDCSKSKLPLEDIQEPSVICAGALSGNVDSCYGDSGGPLQTRTPDGRYVLAGIVSYGYGCGTPDIPGVYTNVGSYLQWINDKISSLGSKPTNVTPKEIRFHSFNQIQEGGYGRPRMSVLFPGQTTSRIGEEKSQAKVPPFDRKKPTFNYSVSVERKRNQRERSRNSKKSSFTFPQLFSFA